ncbi:MAG: insulinase family protein [Candidatus Eremiobacteraeota bacterium]|nr:insulinase family protein [Candidatus Eremiobacteraeota bacterium]
MRVHPTALSALTAALLGAVSALTAQSKAADVTTAPKLARAPSVKLPPVVTRTLPNGLRLAIVQRHELPLVDFALVVGTGSEADPATKAGLASITAAMLSEGAGTRSALDISDQEAYLGVQLSTQSGWDQSMVFMHGPTAQLDSALALFADVALRPSFPAADFARLKQNRLTQLIQIKDRGPVIADRAYASILYGAEHPYGHAIAGTEASVNGITGDDARHFYESYYRPNNATLLIVGDVRPDDIERRISARFAAWPRAVVPATHQAPLPKSAGATTIYVIDKPGAPQSSFRIGAIGVPRSTTDYFALQVMNTILGGAFTSRLNNDLREVHGYTYGAGSRFDMRRDAGPFTASAEIVATKTDSALTQFMKELSSIRDTVPAAELAKAKSYLELQLPSRFETTTGIAFQLVPLAMYKLPLNFYDSYTQKVERVSQRDVQRVARQHVTPDKFAIVIVGDRKLIEPKLRALNVGPVEVRALDGSPIVVP